MQFQEGASNCGVYSISFATDLAYGNNPACHEYEQTKLRLHFLEWLSRKQIAPFLMQYLAIQIVTGNAPCVSKDEMKRQGYSCTVHNSRVRVSTGVLHVEMNVAAYCRIVY